MGPPRPGSSRASKRAPDREKSLLAELFALYAEADALHATTSCPGSTECCRFGVTGREPYVTSLEILAIQRAVASAGGPLNPRRRALPLAGNDGERERTCPLLAESGRCSIYASRPFGCRTYFCTRATRLGPIPREQEKALVARLRALAERHVPSGDLPRPLTQVLRGHGERRR